MSKKIRTFIAVDISPVAKVGLERLIQRLEEIGMGNVRWVKPQGIHLTLKFLGDVDPARVEEILKVVDVASYGTKPFQLALSEVGAFPNLERPRVIWVGLQGEMEALAMLQRRVEEEMASLDFSKEERPFSPHLTLGRVGRNWRRRGGQGFDLSKLKVEEEATWRVEEVHLMQSTLTPSGAIYDRLGSVPLKGLEG